jgi:hypothetical protein
MLLYTHGIDKTTIMKMGRWKSDAVIGYIRNNVAGFGKHASKAFRNDPGEDFANFPPFSLSSNRKNHTKYPTDQTLNITPIDQHGTS